MSPPRVPDSLDGRRGAAPSVHALGAHPLLRDVVHGYFDVDPMGCAIRRRIVPDGCVDLLFHLGDRRAKICGSRCEPTIEPAAAVVGVLTQPLETVRPAGAPLFGLTLSPHAARVLLGVPLHLVRDRVVDLRDIWGPQTDTLLGRLREAPDPARRARYIDSLLLKKLAGSLPPDHTVRAAIALIFQGGGRISMRALSEHLGVSGRQLERLFSRDVGVSPKQLARIARVQKALLLLARNPAVNSWSGVASSLGFADQSHFIREFRAITGTTPAFYTRSRPTSDFFNTRLSEHGTVEP